MGWMGLSSRANNSDFVHRACIASAQRFMVLSGNPEQADSWGGMDREQPAPPDWRAVSSALPLGDGSQASR